MLLRKKKYLLLAAIALFVVLWVFWQKVQGPVVATYRVQNQALVQTVVASGRLENVSRSEIGSQISGVVLERRVEEGQQVKAGDVLFTLTNLNFEAITNLCNDPDYKNRVQLIASAKEPTMRLRLVSGIDSLRQSKALIERYKKCIPV